MKWRHCEDYYDLLIMYSRGLDYFLQDCITSVLRPLEEGTQKNMRNTGRCVFHQMYNLDS